MAAVEQIGIELAVVVGSADLTLAAAMALGRGAVIPLGRDALQPVSLCANGRKFADGKVTLLGDRIAVEIVG